MPIKKGTEVIVMDVGNYFSEKYLEDSLVYRSEGW